MLGNVVIMMNNEDLKYYLTGIIIVELTIIAGIILAVVVA